MLCRLSKWNRHDVMNALSLGSALDLYNSF